MQNFMILPVNASAAVSAQNFTASGASSSTTLSLVGLVTTETVSVQIPRVVDPDWDDDDHWTPLVQDGIAITLSVNDNVVYVPANLLIRLVKDAGVADNAYGVRWS